MVTVYLFRQNDLRRNYDPDDDEIVDRALLRDWRMTQDPEADYTELLETVMAIDPTVRKRPADFHLPMDGGVTYTHFDDFNSKSAATLMKKYLTQQKRLQNEEDKLAELRRDYHQTMSESRGRQIRQLEEQVEKSRAELKQLLSDVYRAERRSR